MTEWPVSRSIEDDPNIRNSLERALRDRGHDVRSAATGLAGLSQIVDDRPDVVILDLGLPDIEGLELLKMLRAVSAVPVIAATARDDEREIVRTLDAGADDYVDQALQRRSARGEVARRAASRGFTRIGHPGGR